MSEPDIPKRKRGAPSRYPAGVIAKAIELAADPMMTYGRIADEVEQDARLWPGVAPKRPPETTVKSWIDKARRLAA